MTDNKSSNNFRRISNKAKIDHPGETVSLYFNLELWINFIFRQKRKLSFTQYFGSVVRVRKKIFSSTKKNAKSSEVIVSFIYLSGTKR